MSWVRPYNRHNHGARADPAFGRGFSAAPRIGGQFNIPPTSVGDSFKKLWDVLEGVLSRATGLLLGRNHFNPVLGPYDDDQGPNRREGLIRAGKTSYLRVHPMQRGNGY